MTIDSTVCGIAWVSTCKYINTMDCYEDLEDLNGLEISGLIIN